jgi:hypothetical protein
LVEKVLKATKANLEPAVVQHGQVTRLAVITP